MKKTLRMIIVLVLGLLILSGCDENNLDEEKISKEKCKTEIEYMDGIITEVYNQIALTEDSSKIDWNSIYQKTDLINSSWSDIIIDMAKTNVNKDDISGYSNNLNKFIIEVGNKNIIMSLYELTNLYNHIPKFLKHFEDNEFDVLRKQFKGRAMLSCAYVKDGKWQEATDEANNLSNSYNDLMNNTEYVKQYSYDLNRIYVLTEELKNSLVYNNSGLFLVKYKSYIEEI